VTDSNPEIAAEKFFGERLGAATRGRYEVKVFPNGTLGDHNRMNEQVRSGTLQMTN
jgi:TRAP-type C4-dicarboxylate transport system substrate-binding protein